ncbi:caspase family protein [Archangium lansingense]|uniref:Caspase family protein n=1 Tax=Archangium lansingense TaxID=2995310 RepID=A0ABT4AHD2_9BACT|nr:caspase family protein [Archangium lansinium]MCY1080721.1 caspase family protein [Archangium lansinium]
MPNGISLHLGLNAVDSTHYGSPLLLGGCHNDALDMRAIAHATGFRSRVFLDAEATAPSVLAAINDAARELRAGDTFLITYAGHGAQVPDVSGDEADALDETWVLFDRMLLDDELYAALAAFSGGVRVLFISDSCHSGSIAREAVYRELAEASPLASQYAGTTSVFRTPSEPGFGQRVWSQHAGQYRMLTRGTPPNPRELVRAAVIQLSGCQDDQLSADGEGNGLFTSKLKDVWSGGQFRGSHRAFWQRIGQAMPPTQSPGYLTYGGGVSDFEKERPFTVSTTTPVADKTTTGGCMMSTQESGEEMMPEVLAELKRRFPALDLPGAESGVHPAGNGGGSFVGGPTEAPRQASSAAQRAVTGAPIVRTQWWGLQIEISHEDLLRFTSAADPASAFVAAIGPMTGPAAPYMMAASFFVAAATQLLRSLDRGNGVTLVMSWFAPGAFVPITTPGGRGLATRGLGEPYEQAGEPWVRNYSGWFSGIRLEEDIYWNLPVGTVRESVIVHTNPPGFGNVYFNGWLSDDASVGHFRLHVGVAPFQGGRVEVRMMVRNADGSRSVSTASGSRPGSTANGSRPGSTVVPGPRPLTSEEL